MKVAERVKPILVAEDKSIMTDSFRDGLNEEGSAELSSWDEEGRTIVRQIVSRFPYLFPYYFKEKPAYYGQPSITARGWHVN